MLNIRCLYLSIAIERIQIGSTSSQTINVVKIRHGWLDHCLCFCCRYWRTWQFKRSFISGWAWKGACYLLVEWNVELKYIDWALFQQRYFVSLSVILIQLFLVEWMDYFWMLKMLFDRNGNLNGQYTVLHVGSLYKCTLITLILKT